MLVKRSKMQCNCLLVLFIVSLNYAIVIASLLSWLWRAEMDDTTVKHADDVPLIAIPYESMTGDEKFLREAAKFTKIQVSSPLETCQHKVIIKLRTACSDMTEEQLAKLSVNLLNCQSVAEGRKMFPCTEEMSLKQCTMDMDADTWNAYHLMSNRARAVCYTARSTQFRALTELTVNKLMQSAHSQIDALNTLKQSQDRLEEQTTEALSSLSAGNKALLEQQQYLKDAQVAAYQLVTTNLRELNNEKALIRSGHAQLAAMAQDIRNKLEKAHKDLEQQANKRQENYQEILQDLVYIQEQAHLILEKVESSTNSILEQHEKAIAQYEQTWQKLAQINDTILYIWNLTNTMRTEVDQKLGWITDYIGNTGEQAQRVYYTVLHLIYILVMMIVASFLQAPFLTRAAIMGIIPVNLGTYLKYGMEASLNFTSITLLILLITGMYYVMAGIQRIFGPKNSKIKPINLSVHQNALKNEHLNKNVHEYTSSSYSNSASKVQLHTKLMKGLQQLYNFVFSKINYYTQKISNFVQSIVNRWDSNVHEELSCSYEPSKKTREDIVHECEQKSSRVINDVNSNDTTNRIQLYLDNVQQFKEIANYDPKYSIDDDKDDYDDYEYHKNSEEQFEYDYPPYDDEGTTTDELCSRDSDDDKLTSSKDVERRIYKRHLSRNATRSPFCCLAKTKHGFRCCKYPASGKAYCHLHINSVDN